MLAAHEIETYFSKADGQFFFARWGRPIAPVIFGLDDASLAVFKAAIEALVAVAGHDTAETDPELGANVMVFFCQDWRELLAVPKLDALIPDLAALVARLGAANQYRFFRFDGQGAIQAAFVFLRMDAALAQMPAADLALAQAAQIMLTWGPQAKLLAQANGVAVLREDAAKLLRAAYAPVLPPAAQDAAFALRLMARLV